MPGTFLAIFSLPRHKCIICNWAAGRGWSGRKELELELQGGAGLGLQAAGRGCDWGCREGLELELGFQGGAGAYLGGRSRERPARTVCWGLLG